MKGIGGPKVPAQQAEITYSLALPVSGAKNVVLAPTANVRIIAIYALVTWTVQPNPLEVHITIDGQLLTAAQANPATATMYFVQKAATVSLQFSVTDLTPYLSFLLEGRSVKIEVETTGGTVQSIDCYVKYQKY